MRDRAREIREGVSLAAIAGRDVEWDARSSAPGWGEFWACCPFHEERTPSFHVTEPGGRGGRWWCFGCGEGGSVIDYVMRRDGIGLGAALDRLGADRLGDAPVAVAPARKAPRPDSAARAREIASRAGADDGRVARYLAARGVRVALVPEALARLRLVRHLACWRAGDPPVKVHEGPAMIARIGRARGVGVHVTWIADGGRARLSDGGKVPKKMFGQRGAILGAPAVLTEPAPVMLVGEGIETVLAALSAARLAAPGVRFAAEAALSLGALAGRRRDGAGWVPPAGVARVIVLADPSATRPDAARDAFERAAARIAAAGFEARIAVPNGAWDHDADFADLARAGAFHG